MRIPKTPFSSSPGDTTTLSVIDIIFTTLLHHGDNQMRKTAKRPSEWLKLLCRDWAVENDGILETCDQKYVEFKPYLKGILTSQLLCRLTIPVTPGSGMDGSASVDFLNILGVEDEFDKVSSRMDDHGIFPLPCSYRSLHCMLTQLLAHTVLHCGPR
jgi:hypothetical protein